MEEKIPRWNIEMDYGLLYEIGSLYRNAGGVEQYEKIAAEVEEKAWERIAKDPTDTQSMYNPYRMLFMIYESQGNYKKLVELYQRLAKEFPNDPNIRTEIERYQRMADGKETVEPEVNQN
jgi:cytochrome c-type biogenesis protein CcmH/NrfG